MRVALNVLQVLAVAFLLWCVYMTFTAPEVGTIRIPANCEYTAPADGQCN